MKFGAVPLNKAGGAVLAHSVHLPGGRLRKGRVLTAEDISRLDAAGLAEIVVARLEDGDVAEDKAALAVAEALVPDPSSAGIILNTVGTGRVNLLSAVRGVLELDGKAIDALNAVDPMITVATVPPWQQMDEGGMVATVKIISYAVNGAALDAACEAAAQAMRMRRTAVATAGLIQTTVPGDDPGKGHRHIQQRLERLGVVMPDKTIVSHDVDSLAEALRTSRDDVILILTASATSDIQDVAPAALRHAGGTVEHFGMPVDPGNLLFIGDLAGKPVIGLPGCARSPALNGADWVLSRVLCGVPVRSGDIATMGVGGLLKEIPTRPQPRRGKAG